MTKFIGVDLNDLIAVRPEFAEEIKQVYHDACPSFYLGVMTIEEVQSKWPDIVGSPLTNEEQYKVLLKFSVDQYVSSELKEAIYSLVPKITDIDISKF